LCLSHAASLAVYLNDDLLNEVNDYVISRLQAQRDAESTRTYVQTMGAIR
jgi:hypothetical protein